MSGPSGDEAATSVRVADRPERWPVERSTEPFRGAKTAMRVDWLTMAGSDGPELVRREHMVHLGAVAALAVDDRERVLLLSQYRHAVGHRLWELPAGLRDEEGETAVRTAQRELLEEAGYRAEYWYELADFFPSAGFSTERIKVFLARGLSEVPPEEIAFERVHEEADMIAAWVPLDEAVTAVQEGRLHNGATVVGILAAATAARDGFAGLRPAV
ncbi:ADP-ribose pyrophosphatase [Nocardiopsis mwathae]|uniref:ADP-ribose pyrophosphatase n=1 Tax=Nocardiopsis mwathae TaxID=1472723 RepID=A0A7X0D5K0_9ACTN|nr:NUDIX hydrolase [Nocardiopsis mwathae]MBB6172338.1 ADP-ribose pyrophosphatase [Nocardiopsis mwathae]